MATKILKNGAVYDLDKKKIVANPGGGSHAITSERATEFAELRRQQKRAVMAQAANEAVERDEWKAHGDLAFVAALADTAYIKATTPDDPKAIDAARFLLQETGMAELKQAQAGGARVTLDLGVDALQALLAAVTGARLDNEQVIDAE